MQGASGMPGGVGSMGHNDSEDMNKDVQFVSEQQAIEVHTLYTYIYSIYIVFIVR